MVAIVGNHSAMILYGEHPAGLPRLHVQELAKTRISTLIQVLKLLYPRNLFVVTWGTPIRQRKACNASLCNVQHGGFCQLTDSEGPNGTASRADVDRIGSANCNFNTGD